MVFSYAFSNQVLKFNFCIWLLFLFFCHYFSKLTFVFNVGNKMTLSLSSFFFLLTVGIVVKNKTSICSWPNRAQTTKNSSKLLTHLKSASQKNKEKRTTFFLLHTLEFTDIFYQYKSYSFARNNPFKICISAHLLAAGNESVNLNAIRLYCTSEG